MTMQLNLDIHGELIIDNFAGNSVCPPLAAALVRANLPEMAITRRAA